MQVDFLLVLIKFCSSCEIMIILLYLPTSEFVFSNTASLLPRFFVTECVLQSSFHYNYSSIPHSNQQYSEMKATLADFRYRAGYHDEAREMRRRKMITMVT